MSWIKSHPRFIFCLTSILFLLVFAEFILRLAGIGYGNNPIEVNQQLHHLHPKNYEFTTYHPSGEYKEHQIYYDEYGYRLAQKIFLIQMTLIVELLFWEMVTLKPIQ